ncbi:hypothetical protein AZE42_02550 [Rhizopogon vesiculosus]|uniref:Uncharacterized protein n=1 Tax=Rhizopogon vesiculosus TaxID=180088 RepID=A0A1J8QN11_9AGAM|nr:hypothetical protein AZE42_02550 [Rhizopogon vesiculosus]
MARETHVVMMILSVHIEIDVSSEQLVAYACARSLLKTPGGIPIAYDYSEDEFQRDYAFFYSPGAMSALEASSGTVVKKVMAQEKQEVVAECQKGTAPLTMTGESMDQDDVERPRKKGEKTIKRLSIPLVLQKRSHVLCIYRAI